MTNSASGLACENIRFSSLFVAEDVSRETSSATKSEEKRMFSQAPERARWPPNLSRKKKLSLFWPYNKYFIDQACSVKMVWVLARSSLRFYLHKKCRFCLNSFWDCCLWKTFSQVSRTTIELFSFHVLCFVFPVEVTLLSHNTVAVRAALATG